MKAPGSYRTPDRLAHLYDHAGIGLVALDNLTRMVDANLALAKMLGVAREELLDEAFTHYVLPRHHDMLHAFLRNIDVPSIGNTAQRHDLELLLVGQDGRRIPVEVIGCAISDRGNPARVHLTVLDATARWSRDAELRESELLHRHGILDSPFPVLIYAEDGEILQVNSAWTKFSGYTPSDLRTIEDWAALAYGTRQHQIKAYIDGLFDLNHPVEEGDYVIRTKSGEQRTWAFASAPLGRLSDERRVVLSTASDVTTQRQAEAMAVLHSAALQATANAIVITDTTGAIVFVNEAFSALTGYLPEEAVGKNPRDLVRSGRHDAAFYREMWDTILGGKVWAGELVNKRRDGTLYPESQTITPVIDANGSITHFVAVKQDLTTAKRLQEQFLQSQKMEVVGRLASGVAHDFNNLLTLINGTTDLVLEHLEHGNELRSDIVQVRDAGQRAATLTRQLLAFSRMQVTTPEVIHLGAVVAGMRNMLQSIIGSDIRLMGDATDNQAGTLIDPVHAEQVLMNLCVNARDAMPDGGTLTLSVSDVTVDATTDAPESLRPGPYVMLAVTDTGTGMDASTMARLFEPFFTTKEIGRGTGLGLSTVHDIVTAAGGAIDVQSVLTEGSRFRVWFPAVNRPAATTRPTTAASFPVGSGHERVLIVEDEEAIGRLAQRVLEKAGYTVMVVQSGAEALQLLASGEHAVDLLFTDMVMPEMTGYQLADAVRRHHPDIRVLYTSGHSQDHFVKGGMLAEGTAFLHKPYGVIELAHRVREVLDRPMADSSAAGASA